MILIKYKGVCSLAEETNKSSEDGTGFYLFLILILLTMGNSNTFTSYFQLFDKEVTRATNIFKIFSATAEGLKGAFETPQKVMEDLNQQ